jgi:hypothetical protein
MGMGTSIDSTTIVAAILVLAELAMFVAMSFVHLLDSNLSIAGWTASDEVGDDCLLGPGMAPTDNPGLLIQWPSGSSEAPGFCDPRPLNQAAASCYRQRFTVMVTVS